MFKKFGPKVTIKMMLVGIVELAILVVVIYFAGGKALNIAQEYKMAWESERTKEESLRAIEESKEQEAEESRRVEESIKKSVEESIEQSIAQSVEESMQAENKPKEYRHEYEVVKMNASWEEAREAAEGRGGHLATITSEEEYNTIVQLINKKAESTKLVAVWLGANNLSGDYKWVTDEELSYTNWAVGEPNNEENAEHYMVMYKINNQWVWNDCPNSISDYYPDKIGYVIEWDIEVE